MIRQLEQLEYQDTAIQSAVNIFKGSLKNTFDNSTTEAMRHNFLSLSNQDIIRNIADIQRSNKIQGHFAPPPPR